MSWIFSRYIAALLLGRLVLIAGGMTAVVVFLDFLSDGDQVIAQSDELFLPILRYSALRLPIILAQVLPISAFFAGCFTFAQLSRNSELAALHAAGVPKAHLAVAALPAALLVAVFQFMIEDLAVPRATAALQSWGIGDYVSGGEGEEQAFWLRRGDDILRYRGADATDHVLLDVTIFRRDTTGNLTERIDAPTALYDNGRWLLQDAEVTSANDVTRRSYPNYYWDTSLSPSLLEAVASHPRVASLSALLQAQSQSGTGNQPDYVFRVWLHERISRPISTVLLVLLTIALARPSGRGPGGGWWIAISMAIGFALWSLDGLMLKLGEHGLLVPWVAAWVPTFVIALTAGWVALYVEHQASWRDGRAPPSSVARRA